MIRLAPKCMLRKSCPRPPITTGPNGTPGFSPRDLLSFNGSTEINDSFTPENTHKSHSTSTRLKVPSTARLAVTSRSKAGQSYGRDSWVWPPIGCMQHTERGIVSSGRWEIGHRWLVMFEAGRWWNLGRGDGGWERVVNGESLEQCPC